MKSGLIVYHKNIQQIYPANWIEKFKESILAQTYQDFEVYECNYGGDNFKIFKDSKFYLSTTEFKNFVEAMNFLLDHCFNNENCDYVFNTNCDDYFSADRIEKQLIALNNGYDIVASNFALINEDGKETHRH